MILELIPDSDPRLHTPVPQYDFSTQTSDEREVLRTQMGVVLDEMNAVGLAANQCGLPYRVFALRDEDTVLMCYNPSAKAENVEQVIDTEGCLSFPNLWLKIKRPFMIEAEWYDVYGNHHVRIMHGFLARAFQHELDHLNGVVFTSRVSKLVLDMAKKRQAKEKQ